MATFRTVRGKKFRSSLGANFRTAKGRTYRGSRRLGASWRTGTRVDRLGAGNPIKTMSKKITKLSTTNAVIAIGGGGAAGYVAGGFLADALNMPEGTNGHTILRVGSTALGSMFGVNFMS